MNSLRKMFGFWFVATMLAAFALPVAAQTQKLQTVTMTSVGSNSKSTVTWNNSSPPGGNSQISSARIDMSADATNAGWKIVGATSSTGNVLWTDNSITIQKMSPVKPTKGFTVTITLSGLDCVEPPLPPESSTFTFTAYTGSSLSGDNFFDQTLPTQPYSVISAKYSCFGGIACGDAFADNFLTGNRLTNKDGSACTDTNVFTTVDAANKKVSLTSNDAAALFEAKVSWPAELVDSGTGMPKATQVSWQTDANGNPILFDKGRACIADVPLNAYATLAADISQGATTITTQLAAVFPPGTATSTNPVPIVVDGERMNVIGQSGTTLTVQRFGGTNGTPQVFHSHFYPNSTTQEGDAHAVPARR